MLMQGMEPGLKEMMRLVNPNPREHRWRMND